MRALIAAAVLSSSIVWSAAAVPLYVHDSAGTLGIVESDTGAVTVVGRLQTTLTDIAFSPSGELFGLSFSDLYRVDPITASITLVGRHGVPGGNALVFGTDGTLYAAGSSSSAIFAIDPETGASTPLGIDDLFLSGGDLAFVGEDLYLASAFGTLVTVNLQEPWNSQSVGPFGVPNVFGIAASAEGQLYGVGGTSIFKVDLATGAAQDPVSFAGQGLLDAYGQSFFSEARAVTGNQPVTPVPLPASGLLLLGGLGSVFAIGRRRRAKKRC